MLDNNLKDRGVSVKVSRDFYKMMERVRLNLNNKYKIKVSSHVKLTNIISKNPSLFQNKQWIKQVKKWNY